MTEMTEAFELWRHWVPKNPEVSGTMKAMDFIEQIDLKFRQDFIEAVKTRSVADYVKRIEDAQNS